MIEVRDLKGKKVNYRHNPLIPIREDEMRDRFYLTIKSDFAFVLGGELCVWLEEESWPILLASLEVVE